MSQNAACQNIGDRTIHPRDYVTNVIYQSRQTLERRLLQTLLATRLQSSAPLDVILGGLSPIHSPDARSLRRVKNRGGANFVKGADCRSKLPPSSQGSLHP